MKAAQEVLRGQERVAPQLRNVFIQRVIFVWVNKREWRHPGPIVNIAVRNAHCLTSLGFETHLCLVTYPGARKKGFRSKFKTVDKAGWKELFCRD
jgi:hypothetical protein